MKRELIIDDPIEGEGEGDGLGRRLFGALGELRPDPAEFREGVERRIAEAAEAGAGDELNSELSAPSFARKAAAFFPPMLLPKGLAKWGVGEALAAKASVKFLPGVLALPLISLLMICVTLWVGVRRVFASGSVPQRQDESEARYAVTAWWRRFWLPVGVLLALGIYGFFRAPGDGFALIFLISTLAFLGVHGALAREGLATRREVGRQAAAALGWLVGISMQFSLGSRMLGPGHRGQWLIPIVLLGGVVACLRLAQREQWKAKLMGPRFAVGAVCLLALAIGLKLSSVGTVTETRQSVRAWIESQAGADQIDELAQVVSSLELAGERGIDLTHVRAEIRERLDADFAAGDFNSLYAEAMIRLGGFGPDDYARIRNDVGVERLLTPSWKTIDARSSSAELLAREFFEPLEPSERARIVELVLANIDPKERYANGQSVLDAVRLFEGIGADESVAELAPAAHELLPLVWVETEDGKQAAFDTYKPDEPTSSSLTFVWTRSTAAGVELMARFGVPEGIDLGLLDAYLAEQSSHYRGGNPTYAMNAAASRELLHSLPSWHPSDHSTSLFEWLISLRVLLAASLLSGLAVLLTLRAPRRGRAESRLEDHAEDER